MYNFVAETEKEIFKAVLEGEVDLTSQPWPSISDGAKDLLRKMLVRDPKKRITAAQALGEDEYIFLKIFLGKLLEKKKRSCKKR